MKLAAFEVHKSWFVPAMVVLIITALADAAAAWFLQRPILWCTLIASSLPLTLFFFVAMPVVRQKSQKS